jgi:hypothetical protein
LAQARQLALLAVLLGAAGCSPVDRLVPNLPDNAPRFAGTSSEGFRRPDCPALVFEVAVDRSEVTDVLRVAGRAGREEPPFGLWVKGSIDADQTVQIEVRSDRTPFRQARLYQLWRGTRAPDGTMTLREPQPSCGREVVLAAR